MDFDRVLRDANSVHALDGLLLGDFYGEPEDNYRGVTLPDNFSGGDATPKMSNLQGFDYKLSPNVLPERQDLSSLPDTKTQTYEFKLMDEELAPLQTLTMIAQRADGAIRVRFSTISGDDCFANATTFEIDGIIENVVHYIMKRYYSSGQWDAPTGRGINVKVYNNGSVLALNSRINHLTEEGLTVAIYDEDKGSYFEQTRFLEGEAPLVPEDVELDLSSTTLSVTPRKNDAVQTAAGLGNTLLDFLETDVVSEIDRVKFSNFWIRSRVFTKSGPRAVRYTMCFLKIRIYKAAVHENSFFIEFARRSGDALVFMTIFRQASQYLQHYVTVDGGDITPPPPAMGGVKIPFFPLEPIKSTVLTPLLDMAAQTSLPSLQVEAAAALADVVDQGAEEEVIDKDFADSLCTPQVFQAVGKLICASNVEVLYPLARFLHLICKGSDKADEFLVKDGLLEGILSKTSGSSFVVAREMSQVLSISVPRCTKKIAQDHASSLHRQLSTAAKKASTAANKAYASKATMEVQKNLHLAARAFT
jgi:hypothetical protein